MLLGIRSMRNYSSYSHTIEHIRGVGRPHPNPPRSLRGNRKHCTVPHVLCTFRADTSLCARTSWSIVSCMFVADVRPSAHVALLLQIFPNTLGSRSSFERSRPKLYCYFGHGQLRACAHNLRAYIVLLWSFHIIISANTRPLLRIPHVYERCVCVRTVYCI